jgi:hypothetical protein
MDTATNTRTSPVNGRGATPWPKIALAVTGDWIIRLEIETDLAGSIFGDGFERGDASCWVAP